MIRDSKVLADRFVEPIASHVASRRGALNELTEELNKLSAKKYARQQVGAWVAADKKKRSGCSLGAGLLLMQAYRKMVERHENSA